MPFDIHGLTAIAPIPGRTFTIDPTPFEDLTDQSVKRVFRQWAKQNLVRVAIKITDPRLTERAIVVAIKAPKP